MPRDFPTATYRYFYEVSFFESFCHDDELLTTQVSVHTQLIKDSPMAFHPYLPRAFYDPSRANQIESQLRICRSSCVGYTSVLDPAFLPIELISIGQYHLSLHRFRPSGQSQSTLGPGLLDEIVDWSWSRVVLDWSLPGCMPLAKRMPSHR